jgi:AcrR family transcriptional regulator
MKRRKTRDPEETREKLLAAAEAEFNVRGFRATDTNRIAKRAGYAPQTFYRHFDDKIAIFVAVYERWWQSEADAVGDIYLARGTAGLNQAADTLIAFHVNWRGFRRSLRHLAVEEKRVRASRTKARKAQLANMRALLPKSRHNDAQIYASLLILERLCDAISDGEFADMGLSKTAARDQVIAALSDLVA